MSQEKAKSEDKLNVILFGGSFNPPHIGHRHVLSNILKQFPTSKVYICPNFVSPFKLNEKKFSKDEIWSLCLAEFESFLSTSVILWDEEIKKDQISFTIDTLKTLQRIEKNNPISLVIGEDNLSQFHQWKSYQNILELIDKLIVVRRHTNVPNSIECPKFISAVQMIVLDNPIVTMSSQSIRNKPNGDLELNSILPKTKELFLKFLGQKLSNH